MDQHCSTGTDRMFTSDELFVFYQFNDCSMHPWSPVRPNLNFRLSEIVACPQRILVDNDSMRTTI